MIRINSEQFDSKVKNGNYVFIVKDCWLCREYLRELRRQRIDTRDWYLIDCAQDEDYYMDFHYLKDMPTTRVYKNNVIMYEKSGVLYEKQLNEMLGRKFTRY